MAKKDNINKITNFLALALCHKIGSIVNPYEIYAEKYKKEYEHYLRTAQELVFEEHFNTYDKQEIKIILKRKLISELTKKDFLDNKKFDIVDEEMEKMLENLNI